MKDKHQKNKKINKMGKKELMDLERELKSKKQTNSRYYINIKKELEN